MNDLLAGKQTAFVWNWSAFGGDARWVADLLHRGGMTAVAVKSHDGSTWFDQGESFREIRDQLKGAGVPFVGSWGYHYFHDPAGELGKVRESIDYGRADFHILNIEDPAIETNPETPDIAATMFTQLRASHPSYPLYFCSHAQPGFHEAQPYYQAVQADIAMMPMCYHTAMQRTPLESVRVTRNGLDAFGLSGVPANYAGALYGDLQWPILPGDVTSWGVAALAAGATGLTWWDLDCVTERPDLLDAVRAIPLTPCG